MLDNTAKLSDIITELQNLEGINQKADLKSALVAKGVNALDTDSMADLISKLNSANLKRQANGTATSLNQTINNLLFTPSKIIISFQGIDGVSTWQYRLIAISNQPDFYTATGLQKSSANSYSDDSHFYIVTNGFYYNVVGISSSFSLKWWAFE